MSNSKSEREKKNNTLALTHSRVVCKWNKLRALACSDPIEILRNSVGTGGTPYDCKVRWNPYLIDSNDESDPIILISLPPSVFFRPAKRKIKRYDSIAQYNCVTSQSWVAPTTATDRLTKFSVKRTKTIVYLIFLNHALERIYIHRKRIK